MLGSSDRETLSTAGNLALLLARTGRVDEAIQHQKSVLALSTKSLGKEHPETLTAAGNLAASYLRADDPAAAEPLNREVLSLAELATTGDDDTDDIADRTIN